MEHTLNDVQQSQPEDRSNKKQEATAAAVEHIDNNKEDTTNSTTTPLTVTFIPSGEGELKEIPGLGQVLETRSVQVSVRFLITRVSNKSLYCVIYLTWGYNITLDTS